MADNARTKVAEIPYLADWVVISFRWMVLLGMTIVLAMVGPFSAVGLAGLVVAVIWNIIVSLLAILNRRLPAHRLINLAVDWTVTLVIFFSTGGLYGPVLWAGLLTLLSSGIYFGLRGTLLSAFMFALVQLYWAISFILATGVGWNNLPPAVMLKLVAAVLGANMLVGLVVGLFGDGLYRALRRTFRAQVDVITEGERKAQKAEHDRMQRFYRLLERLSATLNYQVVLETALDLSATALGDETSRAGQMVGAVLLFQDGILKIGSARRLSPAELRLTFPAERGVLKEIVQTAETCLVESPGSDPELGTLVTLQTMHSALTVPLRRGLNSYGLMLFAHPDPDFFNPDRVEVLEVISQQAVIAIQNARLYQDVEREKEHIIESQEEARKKLARDLHDGPAQSLAAITMGINITQRLLENDPAQALEELARVEDLSRRTTKEVRHMLFTLRPLVLETEGLIPALSAMAEKMRDTYRQNVLVEADTEVERRMDTNKQTMTFYLAEEAVNNARKHAQAAKVLVRLHFKQGDPDLAVLEIIDNGKGFDVAAVTSAYERRGSLGMVNLRERTDLVSGLLSIESVPGRGTCVSVTIPLSESAAERLQRGG